MINYCYRYIPTISATDYYRTLLLFIYIVNALLYTNPLSASPTIQTQLQGSAIFINAINNDIFEYSCHITLKWSHDSFGTRKYNNVDTTGYIGPNQQKAIWSLVGAYVGINIDAGPYVSCTSNGMTGRGQPTPPARTPATPPVAPKPNLDGCIELEYKAGSPLHGGSRSSRGESPINMVFVSTNKCDACIYATLDIQGDFDTIHGPNDYWLPFDNKKYRVPFATKDQYQRLEMGYPFRVKMLNTKQCNTNYVENTRNSAANIDKCISFKSYRTENIKLFLKTENICNKCVDAGYEITSDGFRAIGFFNYKWLPYETREERIIVSSDNVTKEIKDQGGLYPNNTFAKACDTAQETKIRQAGPTGVPNVR